MPELANSTMSIAMAPPYVPLPKRLVLLRCAQVCNAVRQIWQVVDTIALLLRDASSLLRLPTGILVTCIPVT